MAVPATRPITIARPATSGLSRPAPRRSGRIAVCAIAMIAEQVASSEPTDKSMWRVTMMKTMPVAMMATETVWMVRLKILRGVRKRPSVTTLKTTHKRTKAPIMPSRRVSSSSIPNTLFFRGAVVEDWAVAVIGAS